MHDRLQLRTSTIGCYLGSFDPPHFGHLELARELLEEVDRVMLLIAARHYHKCPRFPENATFDQRLDMLTSLRPLLRGRIDVGLTRTVLFLELDTLLDELYPSCRILFGMGDETFRRVLDSASYYRRSSLSWDAACEAHLDDLVGRCRVWNRSGAGGRDVVPWVRGVSSTRVRDRVRGLWSKKLGPAAWYAAMAPLVPVSIVRAILEWGLYRPCSWNLAAIDDLDFT